MSRADGTARPKPKVFSESGVRWQELSPVGRTMRLDEDQDLTIYPPWAAVVVIGQASDESPAMTTMPEQPSLSGCAGKTGSA